MKRTIKFLINRVPRKHIQKVVHWGLPVSRLVYAGRRVQCPVCGGSFRKFLPYGYIDPRPGALCPGCLSLERHRLMWLYLKNETDFFTASARLLHIAPEYCFIKRFARLGNLDYITADLESPLAKVKMDVQDIPFGDDTFDIIFCNHILEHVGDDHQAMRELYRVMRSGGYGIMLSPVNPARRTTYENPDITTPEERLRHFGQPDHLRDYGLDFADRLREAGFTVEEIDYCAYFPPETRGKYGLRKEIIYLVRK